MSKRAVWIFDEGYKIPTFLSVASFVAQVDFIPITLVYTGDSLSEELHTAFCSISPQVEFQWDQTQRNYSSRAEKHKVNRLNRMDVMQRWSYQQLFLFDGDLLFGEGTKAMVKHVTQQIEKVPDGFSFVAGVPEYDRPFYTEKRDEQGNSIKMTLEETNQCLAEVFGENYETKLSGTQFNNGMLCLYQCHELAKVWEFNYLKGLDHKEVNPEDDQLPLAVAMHSLNSFTLELSMKYNSLGRVKGDFSIYHAWNGKWKKELFEMIAGSSVSPSYGAIAAQFFDQMPESWKTHFLTPLPV